MRFKNACVTVNNIDDTRAIDNYFNLPNEAVKYCVYQWEKVSHVHIQAYMEFASCKSMEQIQSICGGGSHIEKRSKTAKQASEYCKKDDSRYDNRGPYEWGQISNQGKRSDLDEIVTDMRSGVSLHELVDRNPSQFVRYGRGLREVQQMLRPRPRGYTRKTVNVLWGPPGVGKSYFVHTLMDLTNQNLYIKCPSMKWWDNYQEEEHVLLDEFPGSMSAKETKVILGEVNGPLETKGGSFTTDKIQVYWITSNYDPEEWFTAASDVDRAAVRRRLSRTVHVTRWDDLEKIFFENVSPPLVFPRDPNVL